MTEKEKLEFCEHRVLLKVDPHAKTAGENKAANALSSRLSTQTTTPSNNSLFPQTVIDPSSPSHVFSSFNRQDQPSFLFMSNTDWMNNNVFFNSDNNGLIDSTQETTSTHVSFMHKKPAFQPNPTTFANKGAFQSFNLPSTKPMEDKKSEETIATVKSAHMIPMGTPSSPSSMISTPSSATIEISSNNGNKVKSTRVPEQTINTPTRNKLTIHGDNVTAANIAEGYIQFVLSHDESYIGDGIESLVYAKRKFCSVPKTADITYSTWDIYQLVLKLHRREIKNWSQLVGQLGLQDMTGRPQFAQRVKRWMHRYKIDCYFDYLLGNKYDFHSPNGKYSGCLTMGNYKKKDTVVNSNTKSDEEELDESTDQEHRIPILLAGSRKRMRDHSQNSTQMIENAQKYLRPNQSESEEEEEEEEDMTMEDSMNKEEYSDGDESDMEHDHRQDTKQEKQEEEEEEEEEFADEEDELASSSSSPSSPVRIIIPSPKITNKPLHTKSLVPHSPVQSTTATLVKTSLLPSLPPLSSCSNCKTQESKFQALEKEIERLKQHIVQIESKAEKQNNQMNRLLRQRDRTERWRKQIIADLARGPLIASDDDDEDDEENNDSTSDDGGL
ncbi:ARS binding protein 2-domain-containing protein [Gilbertella persicaria]|uniref:ARS binding protein 2-domain-containing protein n=1 Tax=Gilbertella persicaria TaxID=101096 RepID=UPI0022210B2F|nr:ARS binding protein 2-domain-containing protein [Gilbertella persicaria]KAI8081948.1 ARS binding protein 2-domain-containing protein [Gilbertella persicaria]